MTGLAGALACMTDLISAVGLCALEALVVFASLIGARAERDVAAGASATIETAQAFGVCACILRLASRQRHAAITSAGIALELVASATNAAEAGSDAALARQTVERRGRAIRRAVRYRRSAAQKCRTRVASGIDDGRGVTGVVARSIAWSRGAIRRDRRTVGECGVSGDRAVEPFWVDGATVVETARCNSERSDDEDEAERDCSRSTHRGRRIAELRRDVGRRRRSQT
jgi:hypothetical protein